MGQEDSLEEERANHSGILAWEILWTEDSGGLQSLESQSRTRLSDFHFTTGANWEAHIMHKQTEAQDWCKYFLQGHSW